MSHRLLILGLCLGLAAGAVLAESPNSWSSLTPGEQAALSPLAQDWNRFPAQQQERLRLVAKHYPELTPEQQALLKKRLRAWSGLTSEQRQTARQNLRRIQTLPLEDQAKIKQRWLDALCTEFTPLGGDAIKK
jgi:hypothetical protein